MAQRRQAAVRERGHHLGQVVEAGLAGQQRVDALTAERKRWDDPAYVKQQAQERLGYAMPGKSITVYVDDAGATHATTPRNGVTDATGLSSHPWYGQIWGSISTPAEGEK